MSWGRRMWGANNLSDILLGAQDWAPFKSKWAPAVWIFYNDTASTTKRPLGFSCKPLLCRSKKLQCHSSMTYKTISTDCSVDLLCPLPEGIVLQLFKSLIAVLKCNSGWAVKTDFIIKSELKTEWKKPQTVAQSPGRGPKLWRVSPYFSNTWDWFIRLQLGIKSSSTWRTMILPNKNCSYNFIFLTWI